MRFLTKTLISTCTIRRHAIESLLYQQTATPYTTPYHIVQSNTIVLPKLSACKCKAGTTIIYAVTYLLHKEYIFFFFLGSNHLQRLTIWIILKATRIFLDYMDMMRRRMMKQYSLSIYGDWSFIYIFTWICLNYTFFTCRTIIASRNLEKITIIIIIIWICKYRKSIARPNNSFFKAKF